MMKLRFLLAYWLRRLAWHIDPAIDPLKVTLSDLIHDIEPQNSPYYERATDALHTGPEGKGED